MDRPRDVAVVGAGPAGSLAAAALARAGHDVLLIDRARFPRHKVCGEFLSPDARGTLSSFGLVDAIAARGPVEIPEAVVFSRGGRRAGLALPGIAWGLSRWTLDRLLLDAAAHAGAEVRTGTRIAEVRTEADAAGTRYTATVRGPGETPSIVRARVILTASGAAPSGANPRPAGPPLGIKCHLEGVAMPPRVELHFFDGGYAGVSPVEDGRVNVCARLDADVFARHGRTFAGLLEAVGRSAPALGSRLAGARFVAETRKAVAATGSRRAHPWGPGPRLGDAAAVIPPLAGDGMAMALRSAELAVPLVDAVLRGTLPLDACRREYERAWHAEFDGRLRAARWLARILAAPRAGDLLVSAGACLPAFGRFLARVTRGPLPRPHARKGYPTA